MLKIAHRGASAYSPENTLLAFEQAITMGADMIECDVWVCASGEVVVIHDALVDRTTSGEGKVEEMTCASLQSLRIKDRNGQVFHDEKVPTLEEMCALVAGRISLNIELKGPHTAEKAAKVLQEFVDRGMYTPSQFLISSFNRESLIAMREVAPHFPRALLIENADDIAMLDDWGARVEPVAVNPYYALLDKALVDKLHARNWKIFTWTVNDKDTIAHMKRLQVDGIFSDHPDWL